MGEANFYYFTCLNFSPHQKYTFYRMAAFLAKPNLTLVNAPFRYAFDALSATLVKNFSSHSSSWPVEITKRNALEILDRFDTLILDCDGVIWHVDHAQRFDRVQHALGKLRDIGRTILFASNNSIPSTQALNDKIHRMTGYVCSPNDNFSVNRVMRFKLEQLLEKPNDSVYLMGSKGLEEELTTHGINHFAASYLKRRDGAGDLRCHFLATSWETGYEFSPGRVQPIAGSLAQCIATCSDRQPTYVGKPGPAILEAICANVPDFDATRACMVGDSLRSDVGFARRNGIASIAVLSGVTSVDIMRIVQSNEGGTHHGMPLRSLLPDFYVGSIMDLAEML